MGQPVAFFEIVSTDAPRAQQFYAELFGWQVAADPEMAGTRSSTPVPARARSAAGSGPRRARPRPG